MSTYTVLYASSQWSSSDCPTAEVLVPTDLTQSDDESKWRLAACVQDTHTHTHTHTRACVRARARMRDSPLLSLTHTHTSYQERQRQRAALAGRGRLQLAGLGGRGRLLLVGIGQLQWVGKGPGVPLPGGRVWPHTLLVCGQNMESHVVLHN